MLALLVVGLIVLNAFSVLGWCVSLMQSGRFVTGWGCFWVVVWFASIMGVFWAGVHIGATGC